MIPALADLEYELVVGRRLGVYLAAAGLSASYKGSAAPNPDLQSPILRGLASAGLGVANFPAVADTDAAGLPAAAFEQAMDVAQQRLLQVADAEMAGRGKSLDDPAWKSLRAALDYITRRVDSRYGDSLGTITRGAVDLGITSRGDCGEF